MYRRVIIPVFERCGSRIPPAGGKPNPPGDKLENNPWQ